MKKTVLLIAFIASTTLMFGQAQRQLNIGLIGVSYEIPLGAAVTIAPTAFTDFELNWLTLGVKANYYFDELFGLPAAWDVYAGANAGFGLWIGGNDTKDNGLDVGIHVGGRWFWSEKWGIYLELGGGKLGGAGGGLGLTMKM
ncbi:MAG: hypothetical protein DRI86_11690 [Bacteroidetes bacterium]|nr:MAG: hypothetical protein DRI86_11690 [Bacteroidota bacterium]